MAYQATPFEANFITFSQVRQQEDGSWVDDSSQEFTLAKSDIGDVYMKLLGIRKKAVQDSIDIR